MYGVGHLKRQEQGFDASQKHDVATQSGCSFVLFLVLILIFDHERWRKETMCSVCSPGWRASVPRETVVIESTRY